MNGAPESFRLADIPFNSKSSGVAFQQSITFAKAAPSETIIERLIAFDPAAANLCSVNLPSTTRGPYRDQVPGKLAGDAGTSRNARRR